MWLSKGEMNALLDYVLVARFAMGVLGSAYASLAVQLLPVIAQLAYFFGPSHSIRSELPSAVPCLAVSEKLTQTTEKAAYRKMGLAGKMKL